MEMTGERRLPASRQAVWEALNDPGVLRGSIPGCRSLEPDGENGFKATAAVRVGPIATSFSGKVQLLDLDPPASYRIEGSGQGGAAGFARGGALVTLTEDGAETLLRYEVKAEVGGKLAQLGARLIDATAAQMAEQFFTNFAAQVRRPAPADASPAPAAEAALAVPAQPAPPPPAALRIGPSLPARVFGYPLFAWVGLAVLGFILFSLFKPYLGL